MSAKEKFIEKVKQLAIDYWTMGLHDGTFESHLRAFLEEYEKGLDKTLEEMLTDSMYKLSAMLGYEVADSIESLNILDLKEIILELIENGDVNLAELQNIFANKAFVAIMSA